MSFRPMIALVDRWFRGGLLDCALMQRAQPPRIRRARTDRDLSGVRSAALLFGVALLLRVLYLWLATGPGTQPYSDAVDYDSLAWNLATGHGFTHLGADGYQPTAFRPPVVPWLTSLLYRAVGHQYFAALVLQCVIGATVPLLLGRLAGSLFGGSVERWAGWLAAVNPVLVFFSGYLLTETTFTAVLLLALLATVEWVKTPRPGRALGVGLLWGLAALTRPTALALPALVAVWAWVPLGLSLAARDRMRQIVLLVFGLALVVGPWTIRNAIALRAFVPVTTGGGRAFLDSNNELVWNDPARRGGAISTYQIEPYASEFRGSSEVEADRIASRRGWEFLDAHIAEWPAMAVAKLARFWRITSEAGGTGTWQRSGSPLAMVLRILDPLAVWSIVTLPFGLWGLTRIVRGSRRWYQFLVPLVIVYFTLLAIVYWGSLRTRMPIEPLLVLLVAVGWDDVQRRFRARSRGLKVVSSTT
jgi:4-amino-4-deoxy-L-arabinose transferase-like glycosyltransferase